MSKREEVLKEIISEYKEKFNIELDDVIKKLQESMTEELIDSIMPSIGVIIPYGKYENSMEDDKEIRKFLLNEAPKFENWQLDSAATKDDKGLLFFENKSFINSSSLNASVIVRKDQISAIEIYME